MFRTVVLGHTSGMGFVGRIGMVGVPRETSLEPSMASLESRHFQ